MEKYVVIYDSEVHTIERERYTTNRVYYADSMEDMIVWLQEHPDAMVCCLARILN